MTEEREMVGQVKELSRLKKRVETVVKPSGDWERSLRDVEEVENVEEKALVEMSEYMDV